MKFQISLYDSPLVSRLKLLYLVPVILAVVPLAALILTWREYLGPQFATVWSILRTGRP